MTSDPYSQAFQQAKNSNQQAEDSREAEREAQHERFQAEAMADSTALKDIVLPELYKADRSLKAGGGELDIQVSVHADGKGSPASVSFRVRDSGDHGRTSWFYVIEPRQGNVYLTRANTNDMFDRKREVKNIGGDHDIKKRSDLTAQNIEKLILTAIEEYRKAKPQMLHAR